MLCFLEVCARPNKKSSQRGAGAGQGVFATWETACLDLPSPYDPSNGLWGRICTENPMSSLPWSYRGRTLPILLFIQQTVIEDLLQDWVPHGAHALAREKGREEDQYIP
jgi:hypothetical protein